MPLQRSSLNNNKIKEILKNEYNIISDTITEINRGTSNIFKITTRNKDYILKEFQPKRTVKNVQKEFNIIRFLEEKKINVPKYVKTRNGNFYTENSGRIIIVQEYIEGYTLMSTKDYNKIIESATILGKIIKELKSYPQLSDENIMQEQFSKEALEKGIMQMKELQGNLNNSNPFKEKFKQDLEDKIEISKNLLQSFDFDVIKHISIENSHGDYCIQQLIYNDNKGTTVIDFEKAKRLPVVWEIMRSYNYIDRQAEKGELNIDTLVDYFREFLKYVELNEYDLKYAPHIYLMQLVRSTFGYKEYNNDYTKENLKEFAFFRTKSCKYIYENLEEISSRLSEIKLGDGNAKNI